MNSAHCVSTPNKGYYLEEEILNKKEYKTRFNSDLITIMIGKTKSDIIIRSSYYELKIEQENLSILTKIKFTSLDESYEFMENIFNENQFKIIEKTPNVIKLKIAINEDIKDMVKEIELCLVENFENKNILIKDLFDKYINIEKKINKVESNNKILKEENKKLKYDYINMKNKMSSIKNNHIDDIKGIQEKIMNLNNQFKEEVNQLSNKLFQKINEIKQKINLFQMNNSKSEKNILKNKLHSIKKKDNFNTFMSNNNNKNNNDLILKNNLNNMNKNGKFNIIFKINGNYNYNYKPIMIEYKDTDLISTLVDEYRKRIIKDKFNFNNAQYIFNSKPLNMSLTAKDAGLENNNIIYVDIFDGIIFKISGMKNGDFLFIIKFNYEEKISKIINKFLNKSGFSLSEKIKFYYNGKILDENLTISETGLKFNSEILVEIRDPIHFINIFFKNLENNQNIKIESLFTEKMSSIIERYKYRTNNLSRNIRFSFNSKIIDEGKTIEELELKNHSIIETSYESH